MTTVRTDEATSVTDFEQRLERIVERADQIKADNRGNATVVELSCLIGYLAQILEIHLRTGER